MPCCYCIQWHPWTHRALSHHAWLTCGCCCCCFSCCCAQGHSLQARVREVEAAEAAARAQAELLALEVDQLRLALGTAERQGADRAAQLAAARSECTLYIQVRGMGRGGGPGGRAGGRAGGLWPGAVRMCVWVPQWG